MALCGAGFGSFLVRGLTPFGSLEQIMTEDLTAQAPEDILRIIADLNQPDSIRIAAIDWIEELAIPKSAKVAALTSVLPGGSGPLVDAAIRELGLLGDVSALPSLREILNLERNHD